jgi:uncharacterized DUF497 family protein
MDISFDPGKAAGNWRKHGVSFEEAQTARLATTKEVQAYGR